MVIKITESADLPILKGILEVDTSSGSITIFMSPPLDSESFLKITKISHDLNIVTLFGVTMGGADILIFGLPADFETQDGKNNTVVLRGAAGSWDIIEEGNS